MNNSLKPHLHQDWIDPEALDIIKTLQKNGFTTFLVGGCVRDLLLGGQPKDFDIATLARPSQIRRLIRRAYVIGRRFRLVLVRRETIQFEIATFRRNVRPDDDFDGDETEKDNLFGTPQEDAQRRDFTINGLFYDPVAGKLIDHCQGLSDIGARVIRMIGEPNERLQEDPIRILRGLRLAHKLGFSIEPTLRQACQNQAHELTTSVLPRRREEILKLLRLEDPTLAFHEAHDLGIWSQICPTLDLVFKDSTHLKEFDSYLHRIHQVVTDSNSALQLFALLLLAYFRTLKVPNPETEISVEVFLDDPDIQKMVRDELGLFKYEQHLIAKALQLQPTLLQTNQFKNKGERRRLALLSNEAFPLALIMAQADYTLAPTQLLFWIEERTLRAPQLERLEEARRPNKRRPRKRKPINRSKTRSS